MTDEQKQKYIEAKKEYKKNEEIIKKIIKKNIEKI